MVVARLSTLVGRSDPAVVVVRARRGRRPGATGDESVGLTQGLAAVEEVEDSVAVVPHQHQGAMGQPAWFGRLTMSGVA